MAVLYKKLQPEQGNKTEVQNRSSAQVSEYSPDLAHLDGVIVATVAPPYEGFCASSSMYIHEVFLEPQAEVHFTLLQNPYHS